MNFSIVGAGRLGTILATALVRAGHHFNFVTSLSMASARSTVDIVGQGKAASSLEEVIDTDVVFLTVPDGAIQGVAQTMSQLLTSRGTNHVKPRSVCHTSGALSSAVLSSLEQAGVRTASLHPLQTFGALETALPSLPNTYWAIEGHPELCTELVALVRQLQGRPLRISPEGKTAYHAAAVISSNYLIALQSVAVNLLADAGIDESQGLDVLMPIIEGTVHSLKVNGLPNALTGPISRGDVGTLRAHLNCLSALDRSEAMDVYCSLGKAAARLAERHSMPITTNQANEIRGMIDAARQAIRPEKMDQ